MITISLFKAIPQVAFRYNTHKMAIPWNEITVAFDAISDFEKEIQELQNQDQIASLLESPEAAPFWTTRRKPGSISMNSMSLFGLLSCDFMNTKCWITCWSLSITP